MPVRSSQEDFLLRELRKVAEMIARALGFRKQGDLPAARTEIDNGFTTLLGPQAALMRMLDPESAARLIGDSRMVTAMARLTAAEAAVVAAAAGNVDAGDQLTARARLLAKEAVKLDPSDVAAGDALSELLAG